MARTKLVNGKRVQLTALEETARDAEELAWANRPAKLPPVPRFEEQAKTIEADASLDSATKVALAILARAL